MEADHAPATRVIIPNLVAVGQTVVVYVRGLQKIEGRWFPAPLGCERGDPSRNMFLLSPHLSYHANLRG